MSLAQWGKIHLIGIGGAGMSVVAELLAAHGCSVQGSDAKDSPVIERLRQQGVQVWIGHDPSHIHDVETVVISTAVRETNPELVAARRAQLRVVHRSEALAAVMQGRRSVAVAGAHGKTTTSAMVAMCLHSAGLDPSYAIGSTVLTPAGPTAGGYLGSGDVLVAEADESDGSFLNYSPRIAVVTNVEPDHLDHYGTREQFEQAFVDFVYRIEPGGTLVACADDSGAALLAHTFQAQGGDAITYGTTPGSGALVHHVTTGPSGVGADVDLWGETVRLELAVPGIHNILNATAAFIVARLLGVPANTAATGVASFRGTGRRFEEQGTVAGIRVVDDYAHHPTEVAAVLQAARDTSVSGRLVVLFQPHLYSRTRAFAAEFAQALDRADIAIVTSIYAAREDPDPSVTPDLIVDAMTRGRVVLGRDAAVQAVVEEVRPGDLVLTVGAGDITEYGPQILELLREQE